MFQLAWVSGGTVGALVGGALPIDRVQGLDFALTALFVVLSIDAYRARPDRSSAVGALGCAIIAAVVVPGQMLAWAFAGYTALLLGRIVVARRRGRDG
jgi:predicted branched-subunit amino acid permease